MPLQSGLKIGTYEIVGPLGAGGMGEVYRANDSRLGRSVAIKVLPELFALDPERIARFEREARALAALNHPHIATLYGLETADHTAHRHLLVMELVEGETLAERISQGPIALETALAYASQMADALDAAHEKGIIHRDLKPANVKITPDEQVKVLDFGLAKAMDSSPSANSVMANSPTLSALGTQVGVIMGTAAYMSPEQAKGFAADHRSDIFSFGVVLFEMLTGRQPFQGETVSDVLASVLIRDVDLGGLPATLNPRLPDLIRRCLEKSPKKRWQAIGDVRAEIEIIAAAPRLLPVQPVAATAAAPPLPLWRRVGVPALLILAASALTGFAMWTAIPRPTPAPLMRFPVLLPDGQQFAALTRTVISISDDGRRVVFNAGPPPTLWVRNIDQFEAKRIDGTNYNNALTISPALSPDGNSVVFWTSAERALKRIAVSGGPATTVCEVDLPAGLTWDADGILFSTDKGIHRVSPNGGQPLLVAATLSTETAYAPQMLPDGHVLFTAAPAAGSGEKWDTAKIVVHTVSTGTRKVVVHGGTEARYLESGHLVFVRSGVLFAVPFDLGALEIVGDPVPVVEGVKRGTGTVGSASGFYSVSKNGTLVYVPGPAAVGSTQRSIALFDRQGVAEVLDVTPGAYQQPRMSPDGKHIAYVKEDGAERDVWVYEVASRNAPRRLTFGGRNTAPTWSADGRRVLFMSERDNERGVYWQRADGTGTRERLTTAANDTQHRPTAVVPGGERFIYESTTGALTTVWIHSITTGKAERLAGIESTHLPGTALSPDGRWLAYAIREEGRSNLLYVEPFPQTGAKYQISSTTEDGHHPVWAPDGKELFYTPGPGNRLTAVPVTLSPTFSFGTPVHIDRPFTNAPNTVVRTYDVARDGKRFLGSSESPLLSGAKGVTAPQFNVIVNWFEELNVRAPRK